MSGLPRIARVATAPLFFLSSVAAAACGGPGGGVMDPAGPAGPATPSGAPPETGTVGPASPAAAVDAGGAPGEPPKVAARSPQQQLVSCSVRAEGLCLPEAAFVARLCDGSFPDAALAMMSGTSPFSRVWVRGDTEGWNADVGKSARAKLRGQEEMLVLRRRTAPKNGVVVGNGGGGFLVMRWDGNCYTLDDGEVLTAKPSAPKHAPLAWNLLEVATKDALLKSPKVLAAFQKRGKECKGVTSGEVSKACEIADGQLGDAVVEEVRGGRTLPVPSKLP